VSRVLAFTALAVVLAGCGGVSEASGDKRLTLVAYSTPREAYEQLIDDFRKKHDGVSFDQSYGSSGEQSRAVESGLPADIVAFSLAPDIDRLVESGDVAENWADNKYKGMVTSSVVVFVVRDGNPKGIRDWDDLVEDGVEVITPNPFTSGGARWNVMAAYGANAADHEAGVAYLRRLFSNVSVQDKSAREALQTFTGGKGDVMLAYENEAILAQQKGEDVEYVVPRRTILIENPIAVTKDAPPVAQQFVDFLRTPEAQQRFGSAGYRPVSKGILDDTEFPDPPELFTIEHHGGWDRIQKRFFDREDGIMADIQRDLGESLD
jgi:sulfate/thiosulfate-binding protein